MSIRYLALVASGTGGTDSKIKSLNHLRSMAIPGWLANKQTACGAHISNGVVAACSFDSCLSHLVKALFLSVTYILLDVRKRSSNITHS